MTIYGSRIKLIPASESDRKTIYEWLARSDLTTSMLGPPDYPDLPVPSFDEFCSEYPPTFFNASGDGRGRNYIIFFQDEPVGTIGYDLLDHKKDRVVLDIWMRAEKFCGKGYGSDALQTLCNYLHQQYGITNFIINPSARNKRAVAAYKKAGFKRIKTLNKAEQLAEFGQAEYDDNVLMLKRFYNE